MATEVSRRKPFERSGKADHQLTPLKLEVLAAIAGCGYLSTPQVARAMGMSSSAAVKHLRDLFELRLLDVLPVSGYSAGTTTAQAPKVHMPSTKGIRALQERDLAPLDMVRSRASRPDYLAHGLAARDVYTWMAREARKNGHRVERFELSGISPLHGTVPDAAFAYRLHDGPEKSVIAGFVEADMGTERAIKGPSDRWGPKLKSYEEAFADEARAAIFAATGGMYRVARVYAVVPTALRAAWIAGRAKDSPAAKYLRIAVRSELETLGANDAAWLRKQKDGTWTKGRFIDG